MLKINPNNNEAQWLTFCIKNLVSLFDCRIVELPVGKKNFPIDDNELQLRSGRRACGGDGGAAPD